MADLEYPLNGAENVYINPRWLTVPVQVPNSIANCYINGTGVADFTDNPAWDLGVFNSVAFHLRKRHLEIHCAHRWFISHSPAQPGDSPLTPSDFVPPNSVMATVGLSHIDHDVSGAPTAFEIAMFSVDIAKVAKGDTELDITVNGWFMQDAWIDRIAYEIDMLIYRPQFLAPSAPRWPGRLPPGFFRQRGHTFPWAAFRP